MIEVEVVERAKNGDEQAKMELLKSCEKMIGWWLKRLAYGCDYEDGMQAGRMGVLKAINSYNAGRGAKFSTWAAYWIRKEIEVSMNGFLIREKIELEQARESGGLDRAEKREIRDAVEDLPEEQRKVMIDRYWKSKTVRQVGDEMGLAAGSVGWVEELALRQLRRKFQEV